MTTQASKPTTPAGEPATPAHESVEAGYWLDADSPGLPITLDLRPLLGGKTLAEIDRKQFWEFMEVNGSYGLEFNKAGELIVMPPILPRGGRQEIKLTTDVDMWSREHGGDAQPPSVLYHLPGGSGRGPDASWISPERAAAISDFDWDKGNYCPDFVAEIRSPSNTLVGLQRKMEEYLAAGARLGWLIDPRNRRVTIYRPDQEPEVLDDPETLSGEDVMPGFEFRIRELIFDAAR